ncbi:MAG: FtsW/RodA/SpoVE family cell cycle protein [Phycisphaerales bacterium]
MKSGIAQRVFGVNAEFANWGLLTVFASAVLSALGVYAIDVGARDTGGSEERLLAGRAVVQMAFVVVGVLAGLTVCVPRVHVVRLVSWPLLAGAVGLLVFLLLPFVPASIVRPRNGCRGWIDVGPIDVQPAELAKVAYVLAMAEYLRLRRDHRTWLGLVPVALITMIPVALITLQPDLGTALLFIPTAFAMLLAAGAKLKHLAIVVLAGTLAAPAMYPFLKPHQKQRIVGLIKQVQGDTSQRSDADVFQASTAIMLVGAGETQGYSDGMARAVVKFSRLPERHNDMVFAVIGARFGMVGGAVVLGLYGLWAAGALLAAAASRDAFGRLICVGCAGMVCVQAVVNVGMNVGVMPIVGLPLPFVSYGGSSMVSVWLMAGLVFSVAMRPPPRMSRPTFEFGRHE